MPLTFNPFVGNFDRYAAKCPVIGDISLVPFTDTVHFLGLSSTDKLLGATVSSNCVIAIKPDSFVTFPNGAQVHATRLTTPTVEFSALAGVNLRSADGRTYLRSKSSTATVIKLSANEWLLFGDISTKNFTLTT